MLRHITQRNYFAVCDNIFFHFITLHIDIDWHILLVNNFTRVAFEIAQFQLMWLVLLVKFYDNVNLKSPFGQ